MPTGETLLEARRLGRRVGVLLTLGTAVVTLAAIAFVAFFILQSRERVLAAAVVTTQNLARLLDENLTASFDKIDLALLAVQDEVERQDLRGERDPAALQALLLRQKQRAPDVLALRLLDGRGTTTLSAPYTEEALNVSDRAYFAALRDGASTVVSEPFAGRLIRAPVIVFGRRLVHRDGTFAGAIIASIDLNHVAALLAGPDVGSRGVVVLRSLDLRAVARTDPHGAAGLLDPSAVSGELRRLVSSGQRSGTYEALAPSDRTRRILTFERLAHHPFYVIVGLAHDDQLAGWRREAATAVVLLVAFVALTWLGALLAGRAVRRQRSAEERLAATLQSIGDGVIAIDVERRILFLNGVAERLTGWASAEARGRPLAEVFRLVDQATRAAVPSAVTRALELRASVETNGRVALRARDGVHRPVAEVGSPIREPSGAVSGAVLVFRDVSAQLRAEEELTRVQKIQSLAVLAGGIAHDFNNLLTGVTGNLSFAREQVAAGSEAAAALADAEAAALRARGLTHQLLTFSRGGAPVKSRVDLSRLVEEAARFAAHGAGTALQLDLTPGLFVDVDPGQLAQVVQNLVINGIQAMGSSGTLRIETRRSGGSAAPGRRAWQRAVLTVSDRGPGIPPDVLPRIFDPFFTTKTEGKGLGLAICHSIVMRHDGSVEVSSPPGLGATFCVALPVSERAAEPAQAQGPAPAAMKANGARVLVMDDEDAVRRLATRALQPLGVEVTGARDGAEAVGLYAEALASARPFAAVIMDLTIPGGMGGLETLARLRVLDPGVVAIVSSGYSNDPIMADAVGHGFRGVLAKPWVASQLRSALAEVLRE